MYIAIFIWSLAASALSPVAVWFVSHYCGIALGAGKKALMYSAFCIGASAAGILCFIIHGVSVTSVMMAVTIYAAIVLSAVDLICLEIPPVLVIIILACSVVICAFDFFNIVDHILGAAIIGGAVLLIYLVSRGRAMGGGDAKLMLASCLGLGIYNSVFAVLVAFPLAAVIQGFRILFFKKDHEFAFGPYLACGVIAAYLFGDLAVSWYLSLIWMRG